MIKNIIFDIGGVLVRFMPDEAMRYVGVPEYLMQTMLDATVNSKWWIQLDKGIMDEEEIILKMIEETPQHADYINKFFNDGKDKLVEEFEYSKNWIMDLHNRGYKIYLLSNYPRSYFDIHRKRIMTFIEETDGMVISAFVGKIKPNSDIYEYLLEKYDLNAKECVFIDDRPDNVEAAVGMGINAIQFKDYKSTVNELENILSK